MKKDQAGQAQTKVKSGSDASKAPARSLTPVGTTVPAKRESKARSFVERAGVYARFWQANAVLFLDERLKRDPLISARLRHFRAQHAGMQLMMKNPNFVKRLPPGSDQQLKYMAPALDMMEKAVKQGSTMKMSELKDMMKNPAAAQQQQVVKIRTRPGPPMKGRRRY